MSKMDFTHLNKLNLKRNEVMNTKEKVAWLTAIISLLAVPTALYGWITVYQEPFILYLIEQGASEFLTLLMILIPFPIALALLVLFPILLLEGFKR
tara:strand:- start:1104 stop:1391 length:288 start_codon:yes stop_codon:yes gene_type:complete